MVGKVVVTLLRMCHSINRYAAASNKCVKNYNKNKESSYLNWAMSQKCQ